MLTDEQKKGLALMREPFKQNQISKLPKPTKQQTEAVRQDYRTGIRCALCGAWHHKDVIHLDYVGHAALTDRLLDCDPEWSYVWIKQNEITGGPEFDKFGGAWIALTVCGVTRPGYGSAEGKTGPDSMKEIIGDALRNAAMRFGAALDLWHKGDLHAHEDEGEQESQSFTYKAPTKSEEQKQDRVDYAALLSGANSLDDLVKSWSMIPKTRQADFVNLKNEVKEKLLKELKQ
jgi:hypothetical protein